MTTQKAKKKKTRIDPADYIEFTQMIVSRFASPYFESYSFWSILSYAYEAMVKACRSYNGTGTPEGWISFKVKKSFIQIFRDNDVISKGLRAKAQRGEYVEEPKFINIDEVPLSTNGYEVQRMIDRQHIGFLFREARLSEAKKRRLNLRFFEGYKLLEIAEMEGISESGVSGSIINSLKKLHSVAKWMEMVDDPR